MHSNECIAYLAILGILIGAGIGLRLVITSARANQKDHPDD